MDSGESKLEADVKVIGWHVVLVAASKGSAQFAYTVGLGHSYQHPEVVVLGLPDTKAHEILNIIGTAVKSGLRFEGTMKALISASSSFILDGLRAI